MPRKTQGDGGYFKYKSHERTKEYKDKDTKRIYKQKVKIRSNKTKIRPRAIKDISDPEVICIMGSEPYYVHSSAEYFKIGYKIVLNYVDRILKNLRVSQSNKMAMYARQIDQRWKDGFESMFGDRYMSFKQFQAIWNNSISGGIDPSLVLKRMAELARLKDSKTKLAYYESEQEKIRKQVHEHKNNDKKLQEIKEAARKKGIEITILGNGRISWGGLASEAASRWRKEIKESENAFISMMESSSNPHYEALIASNVTAQRHAAAVRDAKDQGVKDYKDFKERAQAGKINWEELQGHENSASVVESAVQQRYSTINKMKGINAKEIGLIGEYLAEDLGELIIKGMNFEIESLGTRQSESKSATTSDTAFKAKGVFTIYTSDKVSATVNYGTKEEREAIDVFPWFDLPVEYQFHASLPNSLKTLSELKVETQRAEEFVALEKLCNYVSANFNAFNGTAAGINKDEYKKFKKLVMAYAGWLRISKAILGMPGKNIADDTPIAIRTPTSIYNIADLLRFFINLEEPVTITKFIEQSSYGSNGNFYEYIRPWSPIERDLLFQYKIEALENIVSNAADAGNSNPEKAITYKALKAEQVIHDYLASIWKETDFSSISAYFVVKLKNLKNAF